MIHPRRNDEVQDFAEPPDNALKLTKRDILLVGALRAPSSLSRASQLSAVDGHPGQGVELEIMRPTIEAEVDEKGNIRPKEKVNLTPGSQLLITVVEVPAPGEAAILSESSLATDWSRPEEDGAWADLGRA